MARIRTVKPEFFDDPDIIDRSIYARLLFIGLWTQADRRGRLLDEPRRLKIRLMPGDDVDVDALLDELASARLVVRYEAAGRKCLWIRNFERHQQPHVREAESALPPCEQEASTGPAPDKPSAHTGPAPGQHPGVRCTVSGSGKESVCGSGKAGADAPAPRQPRAKPLAYKPRLDVAWPGRPPVPSGLHAEFISKLGGDPEDARTRLLAWYPEAAAPYEDQAIGDDDWAFWRHRFREWVGTTRQPARTHAAPVPTGYDDWCDHDPRCASREWHAMLLARDANDIQAVAR